MRWVVMLLLPLLTACWAGPDFYAGVPSEQPIEPGTYKVVEVHAMFLDAEQKLADLPVGTRIKIAYGSDGGVLISGRPIMQETEKVRLVALDRERGLFVVAVDPGQGQVQVGIHVYGLVMMTPTGYRLSVPICDGTRRLKPGSPVVVRGVLFGLRCMYADRVGFEAAMRAFADDPSSWTAYARVG
jgi:hypothetical protein